MPRMYRGGIITDEEYAAMQRPVTHQEAFNPFPKPDPEPEAKGDYEKELDKPGHVPGEYNLGSELLAALDAQPETLEAVTQKRARRTKSQMAADAAAREENK